MVAERGNLDAVPPGDVQQVFSFFAGAGFSVTSDAPPHAVRDPIIIPAISIAKIFFFIFLSP